MTFVRIKRIHGKEYAYEVSNQWTPKGPRQQSKAYLGKVFRFTPQLEQLQFADIHQDYRHKKQSEIIRDLVSLEAHNHGFKKTERSHIWEREGCKINTERLEITSVKGKPVALAINEGLLSTKTIQRLIATQKSEGCGRQLAKYFIEAGIRIPKEVFIGYVEKHVGSQEHQAL